MKTLSTDKIRIDGGTQPRAQIDMITVDEYAEAMQSGASFPPVVVFFDGAEYWLADGFHRYHAASRVNGKTLSCEVKNGTQREAVLYSVGANATHGMRRTNADKRRAVLTLLNDKDWAKWSDRKIAEICAVSEMTVGRIRSESIYNNVIDTPRIVERGGTVYEMQTANIGKREAQNEDDPLEDLIDDPLIQDWQEEIEDELKDVAIDKGMDRESLTEYSFEVVRERINQERKTAKVAEYITLEDWQAGKRPTSVLSSHSTMNETNDNIEWAAWSWNPVTGCLHNCDYCYARDIAARFYEQGFAPSFIPSRLSAPANTRQSKARWDGDIGYKNVFTCSMADLFGKWVPRDWIKSVLQVVEANPQWTFLFLTKFPVRMTEFNYPNNVWLGTTVDKQHAVDRAESAFSKIKSSGFRGVCWLSCEPMLERLQFTNLKMFDWVVMGGASKSTQTPEMRPPFDDIVSLYQQARKSGCKVYMKTNLGIEQRIREYPQ